MDLTSSQISDVRSQDLGSRISGISGLGLVVPGLVALASNCVSHHESLSLGLTQGLGPRGLAGLVQHGVVRPRPLLGYPSYTTLGTPPSDRLDHAAVLLHVRVQSVLWAQYGDCVTLKRHLKSISRGLSAFWLQI